MKDNGRKNRLTNARFQAYDKEPSTHGRIKGDCSVENIAYYNGKISLIEDMMIPMNERSSYFGDGVYDAMFTVDHVPLQLDDHLRRFYRSAKKHRHRHSHAV